jgi:hypothetical protein
MDTNEPAPRLVRPFFFHELVALLKPLTPRKRGHKSASSATSFAERYGLLLAGEPVLGREHDPEPDEAPEP